MEMISLAGKEVYPIVQGGMGVGISLAKLSGSVARENCIGTISMVGIGYREEDFYTNNLEANKRAFLKELARARKISKGKGLIGVNIMAALKDYDKLLEFLNKTDVDFIVSGAGLPLSMAKIIDREDILLAPIVSSLRALKLIIRKWSNYGRLPDFIIIEGPEAGGHLGFKREELEGNLSLENIFIEIRDYLKKENLEEIRTFVAGGLFDRQDLKKYRELGASGIQLGTRFIASEECDAHINFKKMFLNRSKEDLKIIDSPVAMPGRVLHSPSSKEGEFFRTSSCIDCIKTCKKDLYCISEALINSACGKIEEGIVFAGSQVGRIEALVRVRDIVSDLVKEGEDEGRISL